MHVAVEKPVHEHGSGTLTAPKLTRSSEALHWNDVRVCAYDEPAQMEHWLAPRRLTTTLVLVTHGSMQMDQRPVNGAWRSQTIRAGELFLRPAGCAPYEMRWRACSAEPMETLHLHLSAAVLGRAAEEAGVADQARVELIERVGVRDPLVAQIGRALDRELMQPHHAGSVYAEAAAQLLAAHLLRHYAATPVSAPPPTAGLTRQQLRRAIAFVDAHLADDLSLATVAQHSGLSVSHFAHMFRRTTGSSLHQYVLQQRIARAQRLLKETDLPIAEIAIESGFADQSHLTRLFKKYGHCTPRSYRRTYGSHV